MAATNIPLYPGPRFATELANTKELVWYAQAPDGAELGPVSKADIDQAARQNQMDANTLLWCEGWKSVKLAGELYPDLIPTHYSRAVSDRAQARFIAGVQVGPYQRLDPYQAGRKWKMALIAVLSIMMVLLLGIEVVLGTFVSARFAACLVFGVAGIALLGHALMETGLFFDSYTGAWLRSRTGDSGLLFGSVLLGVLLVAGSMLVMFSTALKAM